MSTQDKTAPATDSVVVVPRKALEDCADAVAFIPSGWRHTMKSSCDLVERTLRHLASAPRPFGDVDENCPFCGGNKTRNEHSSMCGFSTSFSSASGDVAAKLGEIRERHERDCDGYSTVGKLPVRLTTLHTDRAYLLERIATLEQKLVSAGVTISSFIQLVEEGDAREHTLEQERTARDAES